MTTDPGQHGGEDLTSFDVLGRQRPPRPTTIHPRQTKDLMLAPVAAEIDSNLQRMRDRSASDVEAQLELELDTPAISGDREARAKLVLRQAIRNIDMHGWNAAITADGYRLRLDGGSVSLDLGLSAGITQYIEEGVRR